MFSRSSVPCCVLAASCSHGLSVNRLPRRRTPFNTLFFGQIAKQYDSDRLGYTELLAALTKDKKAMTDYIAEQAHTVALIASAKFRWANWTIRCALTAMAALAVLVFITAMGW